MIEFFSIFLSLLWTIDFIKRSHLYAYTLLNYIFSEFTFHIFKVCIHILRECIHILEAQIHIFRAYLHVFLRAYWAYSLEHVVTSLIMTVHRKKITLK